MPISLDNDKHAATTATASIVWPEDGDTVYGDFTVVYQIIIEDPSHREFRKNMSLLLSIDGTEVAQRNFLSLSDAADGQLEGSFGIPGLREGTHGIAVTAVLGSVKSESIPILVNSQALPSCQIAVPGHRRVVRSDRLQVVVQTRGPLALHDRDAVLEVVASSGARASLEAAGDADGEEWRQHGGWLLSQLTESQRREGPSFVFDLDLRGARDGPAQITLSFRPSREPSPKVMLDQSDFFISRTWNDATAEDTMEEPCVRIIGGSACRGCVVTGVEHGIVRSQCEAAPGSSGGDAPRTILQDDMQREAMAAAAARPILQSVGGAGIGLDGVTVTITSCGRVPLLKATVRSLLAANTHPLEKIIIVEDSGDPYACAEIRQDLASPHGRAESMEPPVQVLCHQHREGQMRALDHVYAHVTTKWVFHLEDDWDFDGSPGFIEDSIDILEDNPNCFQVHLRYREKSLHPAHQELFRSSRRGALYRRLVWDQYGWGPHMWHGFSLGPGLRRLHHLRMLGAMDGYASELHVQDAFQSMGLWAAALERGVIEHTGDEWSERERWERAQTQ